MLVIEILSYRQKNLTTLFLRIIFSKLNIIKTKISRYSLQYKLKCYFCESLKCKFKYILPN